MTRYTAHARQGRPCRSVRDRGSASVELTVLVTPLFVVLLLFVVLCARTASAKIDVNAAAASAARAASLARSPAAARAAAAEAAASVLSDRGAACAQLALSLDTSAFRRGGTATVHVTCTVRLSDLGLPGVPGTRTLSGEARTPVDTFADVTP